MKIKNVDIMSRNFMIRLLISSILILSFVSMIASADMTINGPSSVDRGEGSFNIVINETVHPTEEYYFGLIINPQTMTGDIGDRPPYITNDSEFNPVIPGNAWNAHYVPSQDKNEQYWELVPNNISYPSNSSCWKVPFNGTHYMAQLNPEDWMYNEISDNWYYYLTINLDYHDYYPSVKTGSYTFHVQKASAEKNVAKPVLDYNDYTVTINSGGLDFNIYDYYQAKSALNSSYVKIDSTYHSQKVLLNGTNTDSNMTYLWLVGEGLPKCGSKLEVIAVPVNSNDPTLAPWIDRTNGTWEYVWDIPQTVLTEGKYTIYASSVNPEEILREFYNRPANCGSPCKSLEFGVCALSDCPTCNPKVQTRDLKIKGIPAEINNIGTIEPCCCPGYPCGYVPSVVNITMKGVFGDSRTPMQIWMFGNNQIYDKNYLFNDSFKTFLDKDGTFSLDINEYLLKPNNLSLCDLDNGEYYLLIQLPGQTNQTYQRFDVTLENSKEYNNHTSVQNQSNYPENLYVVKNNPFYWTRAFPVDGPDAYVGKEGLDALTELLNESWVKDRYVTTSFTLSPIRCKQDSVGFNASPQTGYVPLTVQFNDTSSFNGTSYLWDFGDGTNSTERNPTHKYTKVGIYDVTFTISGTGTDGKTKSPLRKYNYIHVNQIEPEYFDPVAAFTSANVDSQSLTVQLIDQSYGSTPLTYLWDLGDSYKSTERSPIHTYAATGTYNVSLIVTDQKGKSSEAEGNVTIANGPVYTAPVAGFTSSKVDNEPLALQFIDQSYGSTPLVSLWSFGDLQTSTEKSPKHTFTKAGTYLVNLTVTDQYAKANTSSVSVLVPPVTPPTSAFVINPYANDSFKYQFIDKSTGAPYSWFWDFGDNTSSNLNSPNHTYELYGNFPISLTVSNSAGTNTAYSSISLPAPNESVNASVDISEKTGSANTYLFADNSTGPILLWKMIYGDGNVSTFKTSGWNETHTYYDTGNYPATLYVTNGVSSDTVKQMIYIS